MTQLATVWPYKLIEEVANCSPLPCFLHHPPESNLILKMVKSKLLFILTSEDDFITLWLSSFTVQKWSVFMRPQKVVNIFPNTAVEKKFKATLMLWHCFNVNCSQEEISNKTAWKSDGDEKDKFLISHSVKEATSFVQLSNKSSKVTNQSVKTRIKLTKKNIFFTNMAKKLNF